MKTLITIASIALTSLTVPISVNAVDRTDKGNLRIVIKNEEGTCVPNAPVYLFSGDKMYSARTGLLGAVSIDLPKGTYRVSSAVSQPRVDGMQRFASPDAHLFVIADESTSVVLTLYPVDVKIEELSTRTLQRIGVADEVAKYTN
jgi:hypothetical protein